MTTTTTGDTTRVIRGGRGPMGPNGFTITAIDGGAKAYAGDETSDVVAASLTARGVSLYNRGGDGAGDYVTYAVDADATGADTERRLFVGQSVTLAMGCRFKARVSIFASYPTTIEWETWG